MSGTSITATLVERAAGSGAPAGRGPLDRFASALTEGLSRAAVTAPAVRGAPAVPGTPAVRGTGAGAGGGAGGGAVLGRWQAEETLRLFRDALEEHLDAPPEGPPGGADEERDALLGLARRAVRRLTGERDTAPGTPAGTPCVPSLAPDRLLAASLLLAECAVRSGAGAGAVLPGVREVFTAAALGTAETRDLWQERRALARDVHDRIGGPLTAALHGLEALGAPDGSGSGSEPGSGSAPAAAAAVRAALAAAARETGEIVAGLHRNTPVPGLRRAVEDVRAVGEARGVTVEWSMTGDETGLPELFRRELALVLREALLNAIVHASADRVVVTTRVTRRWAHTHVQDDGAGFDVAHTLASRPAHGLRAMSERMESVGGRLAVRSAPGSGTRVDIHLPRYRPVPRTPHQVAEKRSCHA